MNNQIHFTRRSIGWCVMLQGERIITVVLEVFMFVLCIAVLEFKLTSSKPTGFVWTKIPFTSYFAVYPCTVGL